MEDIIDRAREYIAKHSAYSEVLGHTFVTVDTLTAMVDFAEPKEKRIAELEDKLANADYQLEGRDLEIKELKAQIEKMKCCANCKKYWCMCEYGDREMQICEKWEIKEK